MDRMQIRRHCKYVGLFLFISIVFGLSILPIIFFHLPVEANQDEAIDSGVMTNSTCRRLPTESVCQSALAEILLSADCVFGPESDNIQVLQVSNESTAGALINGLSLLAPSDECRKAVVPFLCLYLFGLCNKSGVSIQPTSGQCAEIRDLLCPREWKIVQSFNFEVPLPDCEALPEEASTCPAQSGGGSGNSLEDSDSTRPPLVCSKDFFEERESGLCVPSCYTWSEFSSVERIAIDVLVGLSSWIGLIVAIVIIVISAVRYKSMFVFPSIITVYMACDMTVIGLFMVITYLSRPSLYCTSPNLLISIIKVAPFCVVAGMVFGYVLLQLAIWWLFHSVILFWRVVFPFHARSFKLSGRIKYIHIMCVIVALVVPLLPIITVLSSFSKDLEKNEFLRSRNVTFTSGGLGYGMVRFPPILCSGTNSIAVYYSLVFPINAIVSLGLPVIILLIWFIHKDHGLFKDKESKNKKFKISKAEKKLLITFCYYVMLVVIALTSFTLSTRNSELSIGSLLRYFTCEQNGHDPNNPCDISQFRRLAYPWVTAAAFVLIILFPLANLNYVLNVKELKEKWRGSQIFSKYTRKYNKTPVSKYRLSAENPSPSLEQKHYTLWTKDSSPPLMSDITEM